jgi:LPS-assembly protein
MLAGANRAHLSAQQVTTVAPPAATPQSQSAAGQNGPDRAPAEPLPDAPGAAEYPDAVAIPAASTPVKIQTAEDGTESYAGTVFTLDRGVVITYRDRVLKADHVEYDQATGDATMTGHVVFTSDESDERIEASHGMINLRTRVGHFYDVSGSVGLKQKQTLKSTPMTIQGQPINTQRTVYANGNPFLFTGKTVISLGPAQYQIFNGTVTPCELPHPDWQLSGAEFRVDGKKASASNSIFHLLGFPVFWLPYVTHPVNTSDRQSGIYIPDVSFNSAAYGTTFGEQVYWALNRSMDLTAGATYYSARGYEEKGGFRYRGLGQDRVQTYFSSLQDRGYTPQGGTYINQSGTDVTFSGRHDFVAAETQDSNDPAAVTQLAKVQARAAADIEYLSSFPYREAFSPNFNQAISTDVVSTLYATRESDGMAASLEGDRYQGEKRVPNANTPCPPTCEEQVHIIHAPALEFTAADHMLGNTGLEWSFASSAAALKRTQPYFETSGMIERLDLRPELAYPFGFDGWRVRPSIAGRETFYSRSRFPISVSPAPGVSVPVENTATLNRADVDVEFDVRPPALERTFDSGFIRNLFRHDFKHVIEPQIVYRYVGGINSFLETLRFDGVDIASGTNELQYGVTQRLFLRDTGKKPCRTAGDVADVNDIFAATSLDSGIAPTPGLASGRVASGAPSCGNREWITWQLAQKYFFDPSFGGAVVQNGPRDILQTTLDFSGISFLTGPRNISPFISRLRVRPSEKVDVEWDFDYDTCAGSTSTSVAVTARPCTPRFTADNVYMDVRQGYFNTGITYARLDAPARSYVNGDLSSVADYQQMRVHVGFGSPSRAGLSAAATAGVDIDLGSVQYASIVASYNWNCCGFTAEYRKQQLGTTPVKDGYGFNFTIVNIGSAGDVRHTDLVF